MKTAVILISEAGLSIAQSLLNELPDSEIFTLRHEEGCTHIESAGKFTAENFNRYDAFVFIGAMGICVRTIAPCVKNKYTDPAVVCVDSTGKICHLRTFRTHRRSQRTDPPGSEYPRGRTGSHHAKRLHRSMGTRYPAPTFRVVSGHQRRALHPPVGRTCQDARRVKKEYA